MKKLLFTILMCGPGAWIGAETADPDAGPAETQSLVIGADRAPITVNDQGRFEVQVGEQKWIFDDLKRAQRTALSAATINRARERSKVLDQIKDDLGLGDLERIAVGRSHPTYEQLEVYRGAKTDQLFALLKNKEFINYWRRIAWIIGVVADEATAKKLADFIASPLSFDDDVIQRENLRARKYALRGLTRAIKDQPMPWVNEFLVAHASVEQWMQNFKGTETDRRAARSLAMTTISTISRMGEYGEPLAMLEEIRKRRLSKPSLRAADGESATEKSNGEVTLEYIDVMIEQAQRIKKKEKSGAYTQ